MDDTFGAAYARSLASDLVLAELEGRTASQALDLGVQPVAVWEAICRACDLPDDVRWRYRDDPRKRRG